MLNELTKYNYVKYCIRAALLNFVSGAIEPFCQTLFWNLYQTEIFTTSDSYVNFHALKNVINFEDTNKWINFSHQCSGHN